MKLFLIVLVSLVTSIGFAVELSQATNSQLLSELDRRLDGGPSGSGITALYTCDTNSRLTIELFTLSGSINKADMYIGDQGRCDIFAADLSKYKSKIREITLAGLCDSSSRLYRYVLKPDGTFGQKTDTYIGDAVRCMAQAKAINTSNRK